MEPPRWNRIAQPQPQWTPLGALLVPCQQSSVTMTTTATTATTATATTNLAINGATVNYRLDN
ncbi:hypothetical protein BGZ82_003045, partial [Podila clonocystis]